jgi:hypothetical protein
VTRRPLLRSTLPAATLLLALVATPAGAADRIDAKIQCQIEYADAEHGAACQRGVEIATRAPDDAARAMNECSRGFSEATKAAACQRGVAVKARVGGDGSAGGTARTSNFSYQWQDGSGPAAQVEIGDYRVRAGDAEQQIENCMRAFENSRVPPSCLSGFSAQHKPPDAAPR